MLKHFRSKYDNEYQQSESIMDHSQIANLKKEMDKVCLNAIRISIMSDQQERLFSYMDMIHYNLSLKMVAKMCDKMQANRLVALVNKFI